MCSNQKDAVVFNGKCIFKILRGLKYQVFVRWIPLSCCFCWTILSDLPNVIKEKIKAFQKKMKYRENQRQKLCSDHPQHIKTTKLSQPTKKLDARSGLKLKKFTDFQSLLCCNKRHKTFAWYQFKSIERSFG